MNTRILDKFINRSSRTGKYNPKPSDKMDKYSENTQEQLREGRGLRGRLKALGKKMMGKLLGKFNKKTPVSTPNATPKAPPISLAAPPLPPRNPLRHYATAAELREVAKYKHLARHKRERAECSSWRGDARKTPPIPARSPLRKVPPPIPPRNPLRLRATVGDLRKPNC